MTPRPPARRFRPAVRRLRLAAMATAAAGALLLVGGVGSPSANPLPPVGWSPAPALPAGFVPRWDFAWASFPPANQVVLFGGAPSLSTEPWRNDTWLLEDGAWRQGPTAPSGLKVRGGAAMAYLPDTGKVVLFGGSGGDWPPCNDTWLYDGSSWQQGPPAPSGLTGRTGARMVYHPGTHQLVMFGGSGLQPYNETWLFDGTSWTKGPVAPPGLTARVNFAMVYDSMVGKVMLTGGNGSGDLWFFDGSIWTRGPDLPSEVAGADRPSLSYNPQLGGTVLFGGLGGGAGLNGFYLYRSGAWSAIPKNGQNPMPAERFDAGAMWMPGADSFLLFSGVQDLGKDESAGFGDAWYFRDVPPQVQSVTVTPANPDMTQSLSLASGPVDGGYRSWAYEYRWFINAVQIPGANLKKLTPSSGYRHGDQVTAQVRVTDALSIAGPWVVSNVSTVKNRSPALSRVTLAPSEPFDVSTMTSTPTGSDPDGDPVTYHYTWKVNGVSVSGYDQSNLPPDRFKAGDTVSVTVSVIDSLGLAGNSITPSAVVVKNGLVAGPPAPPGKSIRFTVKGFKVGETVEIRSDSTTGAKLGQGIAADGGYAKSFFIPSPFPGGTHPAYAVGLTSGLVAPSSIAVLPSATISPTKLAAGDPTTYSGLGFVPGEQVSIFFPGGAITMKTADANGSVSSVVASPPEPFPGGKVTGDAASGKATADYTTSEIFVSPAEGMPGTLVPVTVSGYGASEVVRFRFDASPEYQSFLTDARGSFSADLLLATTFGTHTITATGLTSGVVDSNSIHLQQTMTLTPSSGPAGTVVAIDSGPGWVPGETLHLQYKQGIVKDVVADVTGSVHTTYQIGSTQSPGPAPMKLISDQLGLSASATFTITGSSS